MNAVAFPDPAVVDFVTNNLIPLRIPADDPELAPRFKVKWTPTLLILDADGIEHGGFQSAGSLRGVCLL